MPSGAIRSQASQIPTPAIKAIPAKIIQNRGCRRTCQPSMDTAMIMIITIKTPAIGGENGNINKRLKTNQASPDQDLSWIYRTSPYIAEATSVIRKASRIWELPKMMASGNNATTQAANSAIFSPHNLLENAQVNRIANAEKEAVKMVICKGKC